MGTVRSGWAHATRAAVFPAPPPGGVRRPADPRAGPAWSGTGAAAPATVRARAGERAAAPRAPRRPPAATGRPGGAARPAARPVGGVPLPSTGPRRLSAGLQPGVRPPQPRGFEVPLNHFIVASFLTSGRNAVLALEPRAGTGGPPPPRSERTPHHGGQPTRYVRMPVVRLEQNIRSAMMRGKRHTRRGCGPGQRAGAPPRPARVSSRHPGPRSPAPREIPRSEPAQDAPAPRSPPPGWMESQRSRGPASHHTRPSTAQTAPPPSGT